MTTPAKGYWIGHMDVRDPEVYRTYVAANAAPFARFKARFLVRGGQAEVAEGKAHPRHVVIEFPSYADAVACYHSAEYQAAKIYVYETARKLQTSGSGNPLDSDGVKLVASTTAKNIADRAIQVLGGYGYVAEYVVERLWRDAKLLEIGGGTLEAHQKNICGQLSKNSRRLYD